MGRAKGTVSRLRKAGKISPKKPELTEMENLDIYIFRRLFPMVMETEELCEEENEEEGGTSIFLDSGFCYDRAWVERISKLCPKNIEEDIKTLFLEGKEQVSSENIAKIEAWWQPPWGNLVIPWGI